MTPWLRQAYTTTDARPTAALLLTCCDARLAHSCTHNHKEKAVHRVRTQNRRLLCRAIARAGQRLHSAIRPPERFPAQACPWLDNYVRPREREICQASGAGGRGAAGRSVSVCTVATSDRHPKRKAMGRMSCCTARLRVGIMPVEAMVRVATYCVARPVVAAVRASDLLLGLHGARTLRLGSNERM